MTSTATKESVIRRMALDEITPSPENDKLYQPVRADDPDIIALAESIKTKGLLEPLVVSEDGYVISGHRRLMACRLAGLTEVPVRVEPIHRTDDIDAFVKLLREHNRQRSKSLDEVLREEIVSTNPDEAYRQLVQYRAEQLKPVDSMIVGDRQQRATISKAKLPMLEAVKNVIESRREFWPLSVRMIHYLLLSDPPLKHASKPGSRYANDLKSYSDLSNLLTRARLAGEVEMDCIADETRPSVSWYVHPDPRIFIRKQLGSFLRNYWRDLMVSQPAHIEIIGEKNTLLPVLRPIAAEFRIPLMIGRGFCSLPPRAGIVDRFRQTGKDRLILLVVSDADPEGEEIPKSLGRSLRDDFGIECVEVVKVGLTPQQAREMDLPPVMCAKAGSSRRGAFVERHGSDTVWEVEAVEPTMLQQMLRDAIARCIDLDLFNEELRREHADAAWLDLQRQRVKLALRGIDDTEPPTESQNRTCSNSQN